MEKEKQGFFKKPVKKEKPPKTKMGTRKKVMIFLWTIFILAFVWSVYKNFTVINTHTVHEVEVRTPEIIDVSSTETFIKNFVNTFYTYDSAQIDTRKDSLNQYMTEQLSDLNVQLERSNNDTYKSSVLGTEIWGVEDIGSDNYKVTYSVTQNVSRVTTETKTEYIEQTEVVENTDPETGEVTLSDAVVQHEVQTPFETEKQDVVTSSYYVVLHKDEVGNLVITRNPTITNLPAKSDYTYSGIGTGNTDSATTSELQDFFTKFFTLYPQADETQLAYYVKNGALSPIYQDYSFTTLDSMNCNTVDGVLVADVTISYKDNRTGNTVYSQYTLAVEKGENWYITENRLV